MKTGSRPGLADLRPKLGRFGVLLGWLVSGVVLIASGDLWAGAVLQTDRASLLCKAMPLGIAACFWGVARRPELAPGTGFQELSLCWLLFGEALWLAAGYFQNVAWLFFASLALIFFTLLWCRRAVAFGWTGAQLVNTGILLLAAVPVIEVAARIVLPPLSDGSGTVSDARRPGWRHFPAITARNASQFYDFDEAHGDPAAFSAWWSCITARFEAAGVSGFYEPYPGHMPPHRLRPNGRGRVMDAEISINSRGFRGPELAAPKGKVYRIVCLGESTTFGITFRKDDKPWPELLQEMIRDHLKPARPVEVVNAGIPAWSLAGNLARLYPEILPLHPDMLVSYHGFNGFGMIDSALPPVVGLPPQYPNRPLRWLAELEYRHDLIEFVRQYQPGGRQPPRMRPPLQTPYAECYRRLIAFAQTNHIRLALGNFCMAIGPHSPQKLLDFYNANGSGVLYVRAHVNAIHSEIVQRLAAQNPGVIFIDTHPELDCVHRKFIDAVHLTQEGRQQLAENIFAAIRPQLEADLGKPAK